MRAWLRTSFLMVRYMWRVSPWYFLLRGLAAVIDGVSPVVTVIYPKLVIDEATGPKRPGMILALVVGIVGALWLAWLVRRLVYYYEAFVLKRAQCRIIGDTMHAFDKVPLEYYEDTRSYDKATRALDYIASEGSGVLDSIASIASSVIGLFGTMYIVARGSIGVLAFLIFVTGCSLGIQYLNNRRMYAYNRAMTPLNRLVQYIRGIVLDRDSAREVVAGGALDFFVRKLEDVYGTILAKMRPFELSGVLMDGGLSACGWAASGGVMYTFSSQFMRGTIGFGDMTMYINASMQVISMLQRVVDAIGRVYRSSLSARNFWEFREDPGLITQQDGCQTLDDHSPVEIEFVDVSYRYPNHETWALRHVSFKVQAGQTVAVVGPNGAGKSTLVKILLGLYRPQEGYVLINGKRIEQYDRKSLLARIGVVFQEYRLFSCLSIGENVAMRELIGDDEGHVTAALSAVGLKEKVVALPRGIHTLYSRQFDEEGGELSGGERQRLAWARALMKSGGLLVLDEPSSALDPVGEEQLLKVMWSLARKKTIVYVSHRLATVSKADNILVLQGGRLVEQGTHQDLMTKGGLYATLYGLQARKYVSEGAEADGKRAAAL